MRRIVFAILGGVVGVGLTGGAQESAAQSPIPLAIEARAEAVFPRGALDEGWGPGYGFGVNAAVQLLPNYGLYGGYSSVAFDADAAGGPTAVDSGFAVGLTRAFPIPGTGAAPWVGTGLLIHDLEVRGVDAAGGDSQLGFEVGGGVAVSVAPRIRVTPGIGYRQYGARIAGTERETVSYFSAGVGLNMSF